MKLQSRLFLWISALFLLAGVVAFVLVGYVSSRQLEKAKSDLKQKILTFNEKKRESIEHFLASSIAESQAPIDILLERLSSYFLQLQHFAPTEENLKNGTWLDSASILENDKTFDFIQNTNQGKLASLIVPQGKALESSYRTSIGSDLAWVVLGNEEGSKEPYLGVKIPIEYKLPKNEVFSGELELQQGDIPEGYILFKWDDLLNPALDASKPPVFKEEAALPGSALLIPWTEVFQEIVSRFFNNITEAKQYLNKGLAKFNPSESKEVKDWIAQELASKGNDLNKIELAPRVKSTFSSSFLTRRLQYLAVRYDQLYMIWTLAALFKTGVFGDNIFASPSPKGIAIFAKDQNQGEGLHSKDVFFSEPMFDDAKYFNENCVSNSNIGDGIAVFRSDKLHQVYLGNTAQIRATEEGKDKVGYLTLAIDGDTILRRLVLAIDQTAMLIHEGEVFGAFSQENVQFDVKGDSKFPIEKILAAKSGDIMWKGEKFFFLHMIPFPGIDLHFILLNPFDKEFALLNELQQGAQTIVYSVLLDFHLIGLALFIIASIILHNIARRITGPISQLATATNEIAAGHLEEVHFPHSTNKSDEVFQLCRSFEEMVKGLIEKEKVKGVLNKVVSQEIAQEILKGHVHLGGEEKRVTVLFADIRNFTQITQNMSPKKVVELLNACMTKISFVVDHFGGVIDKYVGDEAMALFGAPIASPQSALRAVKSALMMIDALKGWNRECARFGLVPVEIGVGIHTGEVLAGNMGAENRLNYTVLGSNVNFASRLCSNAKGMEILISKNTLNEPGVKEAFEVEEVEPMTFKGFDKPVIVYRVIKEIHQ